MLDKRPRRQDLQKLVEELLNQIEEDYECHLVNFYDEAQEKAYKRQHTDKMNGWKSRAAQMGLKIKVRKNS